MINFNEIWDKKVWIKSARHDLEMLKTYGVIYPLWFIQDKQKLRRLINREKKKLRILERKYRKQNGEK